MQGMAKGSASAEASPAYAAAKASQPATRARRGASRSTRGPAQAAAVLFVAPIANHTSGTRAGVIPRSSARRSRNNSLAAPSAHTATHPRSATCFPESTASAAPPPVARRGGSRMNFQITASVTSPGTTASRNSVRSFPGKESRNSMATSGPIAAPAWSMARIWPKARPRDSGSTRSQTKASRGAERTPLPKRSMVRTRTAARGVATRPISGRTIAESP